MAKAKKTTKRRTSKKPAKRTSKPRSAPKKAASSDSMNVVGMDLPNWLIVLVVLGVVILAAMTFTPMEDKMEKEDVIEKLPEPTTKPPALPTVTVEQPTVVDDTEYFIVTGFEALRDVVAVDSFHSEDIFVSTITRQGSARTGRVLETATCTGVVINADQLAQFNIEGCLLPNGEVINLLSDDYITLTTTNPAYESTFPYE